MSAAGQRDCTAGAAHLAPPLAGNGVAAEGEPAPLVQVSLARRGGPVTVWAEATDNPDLVIVLDSSPGPVRVRWTAWFLVHVPTGRGLPLSSHAAVRLVRAMARRLTDLDWSGADPAKFQTDPTDPRYAHRVIEASTELTADCDCDCVAADDADAADAADDAEVAW